MRVSQLLLPTLREAPAEAEIISHQLLLRAGFIRKSAAGVYTLLPLGLKVIKKIEAIVREEMNREGAQEIIMPIIQPSEIWQESGRWDVYGPELFRLKDRHGRVFCLGPTHEEIITDLVRNEVKSYRQLPLLLYQIQNKYRDERRPRFGLIRGREFIMKDLYSFDRDEAGMEVSYQKMFNAYTRIFERCGLYFRPVEADSGAIGGSDTHEFMVLAETGEALLVFCSQNDCGYAANVERAASPVKKRVDFEEPGLLAEVATPGKRTVEEVTLFLGVEPQKLIKTLLYETEAGYVAALVRGDRIINQVKIQKALGVLRCDLADAEAVERLSGAKVGFAGPVGLKGLRLVADLEVVGMANAVSGANKDDAHFINVNPERDFNPDQIADLRQVQSGDPCPICGSALEEARGIEVGQVFKLGYKYSKALGANYLDEKGNSIPICMGTYGIGVTRTMAASVEQNHDQNGIIWPVSIAPYQALVVPVNTRESGQFELAERVYELLLSAGMEAVLDDRPERAGVKFKDADLIGYPLRLIIGKQAVESGNIEVFQRKSGLVVTVPLEQVVGYVKEYCSQI
ncbi:MAG TPA: proline--tRNA ligase [Desulfotomaculum sp.]|nr:MAG: Proline--tRNA ligase [Desulfotomaculum sp. 46_80]HBY05018.1 proline--tRNA ligase [Desulfotomaculum sp.]